MLSLSCWIRRDVYSALHYLAHAVTRMSVVSTLLVHCPDNFLWWSARCITLHTQRKSHSCRNTLERRSVVATPGLTCFAVASVTGQVVCGTNTQQSAWCGEEHRRDTVSCNLRDEMNLTLLPLAFLNVWHWFYYESKFEIFGLRFYLLYLFLVSV